MRRPKKRNASDCDSDRLLLVALAYCQHPTRLQRQTSACKTVGGISRLDEAVLQSNHLPNPMAASPLTIKPTPNHWIRDTFSERMVAPATVVAQSVKPMSKG